MDQNARHQVTYYANLFLSKTATLMHSSNPMAKIAKILTTDELDSVECLNKIRKAVYLMQSTTIPGSFRFGGIGAIDGQANTPIRRLGQCTKVVNGQVAHTWRYVAIVEFEAEASAEFIRSMEKKVRHHLFYEPGKYREKRFNKKDAIQNTGESPLEDFMLAVSIRHTKQETTQTSKI